MLTAKLQLKRANVLFFSTFLRLVPINMLNMLSLHVLPRNFLCFIIFILDKAPCLHAPPTVILHGSSLTILVTPTV